MILLVVGMPFVVTILSFFVVIVFLCSPLSPLISGRCVSLESWYRQATLQVRMGGEFAFSLLFDISGGSLPYAKELSSGFHCLSR